MVFLVLTLIIQAVITFLLTQMSNPPTALQSQFAFSAESFSKIINEWNNLDRSIFLSHYLFDFIYPFVYGRFFYLALKFTQQLKPVEVSYTLLSKALLLPAVATICDLIENIFHFLMIGQYIAINNLAVVLAAICASVKWSMIVICIFVLFISFLRKMLKKA